ncbi:MULTISPECIES: C40 family peptidase [Pseudanabaena]|uniref:NLP/P60 protein n=2 Tax=Pseudanabaena TaxID=1152 RepID=L8MZ18_9CYAN|nr:MULTISPECIES: C40 family peptidase [Pseudanabaena]ELS33227.1 NLP/P60 protein [Pseudanabaena biceps PCC 7429]MDG3494570.1 C40 family peptidase [Pseudanabaena catenata USMAC16]
MLYRSLADLNIYDSPRLDRLATQMAKGRYLQAIASEANFLKIQLLEDGYEGLLDLDDLAKLEPSNFQNYIANFPPDLSAEEIGDRLPAVINFIQTAMATPNEYLWGGTVAPNYDCSGLMQAAFAASGVWIPRDAYQQEAFGDRLALEEVQVGDLIFFGSPIKATHVGIYIGNGEYIHSSGKEHGHNGIAVSAIAGQDRVSQWYASQLRGVARITRCNRLAMSLPC